MTSRFRFLIVALLAAASFSFASAAQMTVITYDTTSYADYLDTFIDKRADAHTDAWLITRIPLILKRIDLLQTRDNFTQKVGAIIGYLEYKLTLLYAELAPNQSDYYTSTTGSVTTGTFTTSLPSRISEPQRFTTTQLLLGGQASVLNQQLEFSVSNEDIIINDLILRSSISNLDEVIEEMGLYDEEGRLFAVATPIDNRVTFRNLNQQVDRGSHTRYLAALPQLIGRNLPGISSTFSLRLDDIDAEGATTRRDINPTLQTDISTTITVAPVAISEVRFVDTRSSYRTDTFLIDGETTLGILEIATANSDNTSDTSSARLETVLDTLEITVGDSTIARNVASRLRLQRLDIQSTSIAGSVNGSVVTFDLDDLGTDRNLIEEGQTAVFRLVADLDLDSSRSEAVQLSVRDLHNGGITYHSSDDAMTIDDIQQWESEVIGDYIRD